MWKTISKSILILSMFLGVFFGFAIFESFAWFSGRGLFDVRSLKNEVIAILAGLALGTVTGVMLDYHSKRTDMSFSSQTIWVLTILGSIIFFIVRIAIQPAN